MVLFSAQTSELETSSICSSPDELADGVFVLWEPHMEREEIRNDAVDAPIAREVFHQDSASTPPRFTLCSAPEAFRVVREAVEQVTVFCVALWKSAAHVFDFLTSYLRLFGGSSLTGTGAAANSQVTRPLTARVVTRFPSANAASFLNRIKRVLFCTAETISGARCLYFLSNPLPSPILGR